MKQTTLIFCIAALLAAPLARAAPRNISAEIAAQRSDFVSAKVYAVTSNPSPRTHRTEESVARGCYYAATGDDLGTLLDVLVSGELKEAAPHQYGIDVHTVIYLTKRDATTTTLALSREVSAQAIRGDYDRTVPVEARMGLGAALDKWTTSRAPVNPETSQPCISSIHIIDIR